MNLKNKTLAEHEANCDFCKGYNEWAEERRKIRQEERKQINEQMYRDTHPNVVFL